MKIRSLALLFSVSGSEDDLEYYVRECGDILGVCSKLPSDCRDAKHILDYIFHQVVEFKKLNQVIFLLTIVSCESEKAHYSTWT